MESSITINQTNYKFVISDNSVFLYKEPDKINSFDDLLTDNMMRDLRDKTQEKLTHSYFDAAKAKKYIDDELKLIDPNALKTKKTNTDFSPATAYLALIGAVICGLSVIAQSLL